MAKQTGDIFLEGSIENLCFYKMGDEYYVRMKTSLRGKRFWRDAAFEGSRRSCSRFGQGNKLASIVYGLVESKKKSYPLFCFLRKRAIQLFKEGASSPVAAKVLIDYLEGFGFVEREADQAGPKMGEPPVSKGPINFQRKFARFSYTAMQTRKHPQYYQPIIAMCIRTVLKKE